MPALLRVRSRWSGFSGAPGYTVMHFRDFGTGDTGGSDPNAADAAAAVARVRTFMGSVSAICPPVVQIQVEGDVDLINSDNGQLIESYSVTPPSSVTGAATGGYSAASGAVVNWRTSVIRNGRRIRGRSFLVPLASSQYGNDGLLIPTALTRLRDAADALRITTSSPDLCVFARPTTAGGTDGTLAVVTGSSVPSMVAVLRSRRD